MEKLRKAEQLLVKLEGAVLTVLLSFMTLLAFTQVARRQLFGTGALWADTLLRYLVLWVGFLGAALAAADGKHFAWEAVAHAGGKKGAALRAAASVAAIVITLLLVRASWSFFLDERAAANTLFSIGGLAFKSWIFALAIPVGFSLVTLHMAFRAAAAAGELSA